MTSDVPNVLVVEDEPHVRRFLSTTLVHNGYRTVEASTGKLALDLVTAGGVSLVLLDLGLPDVDGLDVAARIRSTSQVPIIIISARDLEHVKIDALDRGANDYVTKPLGAGELLARIRVALRLSRQSGAPAASSFSVGGLRIELDRRQVFVDGQEVHLTPTEFDLLSVLVENAGRVISHRELLRRVWGPASEKETQYLRVYMRQIRYKLEAEPAQPRYLLTVSGVGYRLKVEG